MDRLITGIRPTNNLTVANLIGAAMPLLELQNRDNEVFVFVASMHGLTDHEPSEVMGSVEEIVKDYLALGLDPKKVTIFDQRAIRRQVALLKLYLERYITVSRACRVPTLKDKLKLGQNPEQANVLLMNYPVMMAADIFLQDAKLVPVGKDQYSHIEIAKELADSFNAKYPDTLIRPEALNKKDAINILALNGEGKMSKSKPEGAIFLSDSPEVIKKKISKAETAIEGELTDKLTSLVKIATSLNQVRNKEVKSLLKRHLAGDKVLGDLKKLIIEIVVDFTVSFQEKRSKITNEQVAEVLEKGGEKATQNADLVIERVEKAMGIV